MGLDTLIPVIIAFLSATPWLSHMLFGAVGGIVYLLRQKTRSYVVKPIEWLARPVIGGIAAWVLTIALGLPNHLTSLFVGYFGIDVWDAVSSRFERMLPMAFEHTTLEDAVLQKVKDTEAAAAAAGSTRVTVQEATRPVTDVLQDGEVK